MLPLHWVNQMRDANGKIRVQRLPKLADVPCMSLKRIKKAMRFCPYSEFFGQPIQFFQALKLNHTKAKMLLTKNIIRYWDSRALGPVYENRSSEEEGSGSANVGRNQLIIDDGRDEESKERPAQRQ